MATTKKFTLKQLPRFGFSGEGIPEHPPVLPQNLKIYHSTEKNWDGLNRYFCHEYYILTLVLSGERSMVIGELEIKLAPGDAIIIPPFTRHAVVGERIEPFEELKASFRIPDDKSHLKDTAMLRFKMKKNLQKKYFETAENFYEYCQGDAAAGEICVCNFAILLRQIISQLSDEIPCASYQHRDYRRLSEIVEYLAANRNRKVSLKELSRVLHLSGSTIRQLFKRRMGVSLGHYELTRRLKHGVEILRSSDMTAGEVAPLVGFESASSFLRALHRETGATSRSIREISGK